MNTKTCRQCGELKPTSQYRTYYGGRKGTYTICKACEKINSRAKYLERKKDSITASEQIELDKIYRLYEAQRACGLQPPRKESGRSTKLVDNLDDMIENYTAKANSLSGIPQELDTEATPTDILKWLTEQLTEEPDYYIDEVYEDLKAKYRQVTSIDKDTLLPTYDDTHKVALDAVLDRFYKYEDSYYEGD